jgi:hypothetical protein
MNTKLTLAIMAGALGLAVQANASLFELNYNDGNGDTLSGTITASLIAPYTYEYSASWASLTLTSANDPSINGTYSLFGSLPAIFTGPNNILYYPGSPIVDWNGALVLQSISGTYLNLFSATPGGQPISYPGAADYALVAWSSTGGYVGLSPGNNGVNNVGAAPLEATLTAVPEPTTIISGALLLLPFGASTLRILRKKQVA